METHNGFKLAHRFWDDLTEAYLKRENPEGKPGLATVLDLEQLSESLENFIITGLAGSEGGLTDYKLLDYYGGKVKQPKKGYSRQTLTRLYNPFTKYSPMGVLIDLLCSYTYGLRYEECVSRGKVEDNLKGYEELKYKWNDIPDGRLLQDSHRTHKNGSSTSEESQTPTKEYSDELPNQDHSRKNFGFGYRRFPKYLIKYLIGFSVILISIFFYLRIEKSGLNNYKTFESEMNNSPFNTGEPPNGRDCPTLSVGNVTTNEGVNNGNFGCWTLSSVPAVAGDDVNVYLYYHNCSSSAATNVRVKVIKYPNDNDKTSKNFKFQVKIHCDQGELVSRPVEINLDSENYMFYGHTSWYVNARKTPLIENSNGDEIMKGPGLFLGNIGTDSTNNQGNLIVVFGVGGQKLRRSVAGRNSSPFNRPQGLRLDCPPFAIGNSTSRQGIPNDRNGCWSLRSITAKKDDTVGVSLFFRNYMNAAATNVKFKLYMTPTSLESNHFTFQAKISCDQGELLSDTAAVYLDSSLYLSYYSTLLLNYNGIDSTIKNPNILDNFFNNKEGANLGSVNPGIQSAGYLLGIFQVVKRNDL